MSVLVSVVIKVQTMDDGSPVVYWDKTDTSVGPVPGDLAAEIAITQQTVARLCEQGATEAHERLGEWLDAATGKLP